MEKFDRSDFPTVQFAYCYRYLNPNAIAVLTALTHTHPVQNIYCHRRDNYVSWVILDDTTVAFFEMTLNDNRFNIRQRVTDRTASQPFALREQVSFDNIEDTQRYIAGLAVIQ